MKISEYLVFESVDLARAKKLARVIDIYRNVFTDYTDDLQKPLTQEVAESCEFVAAFEYLEQYLNDAKILNVQLKLIDLMEKNQYEYLQSEMFRIIKEKTLIQLSTLCN
jgi:hypothetical protein